MLELRKMNYEDIVEQWKYITLLPANENGLTNPYEGVSFDIYRDSVLPELMMHENPVHMPDWFVPETYYYLWEDDRLLGEFRIRHYLTEALKTGAGHIGYSIQRDSRGKGYGTKGLALALALAKKNRSRGRNLSAGGKKQSSVFQSYLQKRRLCGGRRRFTLLVENQKVTARFDIAIDW